MIIQKEPFSPIHPEDGSFFMVWCSVFSESSVPLKRNGRSVGAYLAHNMEKSYDVEKIKAYTDETSDAVLLSQIENYSKQQLLILVNFLLIQMSLSILIIKMIYIIIFIILLIKMIIY